MIYEKKHEALFIYIMFSVFAIGCGIMLCGKYLQTNGNGYDDVRKQIADIGREQHNITTEMDGVAKDLDRVINENSRIADKFEENRRVIAECREILERCRIKGKTP